MNNIMNVMELHFLNNKNVLEKKAQFTVKKTQH
jgi:hypothetical protein